MNSKTWTRIIALVLLAALAIPVRLAAQQHIRYTVTDLGTLGGTFSQAFGVNNKGSVVGYATLTGDTSLHAFLWRKGAMTDLGTLGGTDTLPASGAYSINDDDEAVGFSETSIPDSQNTCGDSLVCLPVLWRDKTITALPTLGGTDGSASAINNRGQVVGIAESSEIDPTCQTPVVKPTVWEKGEPRALPTAPFLNGLVGGGPGPAGNNDRGQVVGIAFICDFSAVRPLIWEKNQIIDMGNIGSTPAPVSINNKVQVTGIYPDPASGVNRAFFWQDGVATDLGTLPGDVTAEVGAINDRGQIVGQSCSTTSCSVFIWQNGAMIDLNAIVPADTSLYPFAATDVSSRGEIVGVAFDKSSGACCHGFLAIPDNSAAAENASPASGEAAQRPKPVLPESVRRMLRQQLGSRYHIPGLQSPSR
jgi:probable HAF family extracellular repeat protein